MLRTDRLAEIIQRDANGFILTGSDLILNDHQRPESWTLDRQPMFLEAAIRDLFVAGDVRHGFTKRVAPEVGRIYSYSANASVRTGGIK
jgi:thioredoxin reductase (NADPH)